MSHPQKARPAKLVIGALLGDRSLLKPITAALQERYGAVDFISPWFDFPFTDYYTAEMGTPLYRRMLVFQRLIAQDALADIKLHTNALENDYAQDGKRRVNLDPGYLLYERFVLATGKNFTHRIYIGQGIYADLTLIYQKGDFQKLKWTYPDYADTRMRRFLSQVRQKYASDLQGCASSDPAINTVSCGKPIKTASNRKKD